MKAREHALIGLPGELTPLGVVVNNTRRQVKKRYLDGTFVSLSPFYPPIESRLTSAR